MFLLPSIHPSPFLPLPPSLTPSVLLLASGRTIKSFPGLSHPMSRMMRICSLNQNSHLLLPSLSALLFLAFSIIFSCLFIAYFLHHLVLVISLFSCQFLNNIFCCMFSLFFCLSFCVLWLKLIFIYTLVSVSFFFVFSLIFSFFSLFIQLSVIARCLHQVYLFALYSFFLHFSFCFPLSRLSSFSLCELFSHPFYLSLPQSAVVCP